MIGRYKLLCKTFIFLILMIIAGNTSGQLPFVSGQGSQGNLPHSVKQQARSEWFFGPRADQNGSMRTYLNAMSEYKATFNERSIPENSKYAQWYPLGPSVVTHPVTAQLGQIYSLWVDTSDYQTIYVGSNTGGAWATYDGGNNWKPLTGDLFTTGVLSIQVDPRDKNHIFLGTGHLSFNRSYGVGVLESRDAGATWQQNSLDKQIIPNGFVVQKMKIHPASPDTLLALLNTEYQIKGLIYRSTDGAQTWEKVFDRNKAELFSINHHPTNPDKVYACGNALLKSEDAGATWLDITASLPMDTNFVPLRLQLAFSEQNPDLLLAYCETYDTTNTYPGARKYLFRSFDQGQTYEELKMRFQPLAGYWKMQLAISPANNDEFYLGGIWLFKYRIEEDSAKFIYSSDHKYHIDVRDLHVFPNGENDILFMANDGGVSRSDSGAVSWYDITRNGMQILQLHNINTGDNSDMMFGGPQDANLSFYNFKTKEWTRNIKVSDAYEGAIDHQNPDIVYLVGVPPRYDQPHIFIKKSIDGGKNFENKGIPDSTEVGRWDKPLEMDPVDPNVIYVGVRNVWKSVDGAETFVRISDFPNVNDPKLVAIRIAPSNRQVIYAAFQNPDWKQPDQPKLFVTPDGGNRWFNITPMAAGLNLNYAGISDIAIHPENPQKIWISLVNNWTNRRVYQSTDGGLSWNNFSEGLPNLPINKIKYIKGAGYDVLLAATDAGIFYRDSTITEWVLFGTGLPQTIVADIEISYKRKKIVAGTFGRGLWEADLCLPLDENDLRVTENIEWNNTRNILQSVIVDAGAKLTIRGNIEMGRGRSISVMPGGKLSIEGGSISSNCADLWEGIKVYGNPDFNKNEERGQVFLGYGASIKNAIVALESIGIDSIGNPVEGTSGGIIEARNANFINNRISVKINSSSGINPSSFKLCRFTTNNALLDGSLPGDMVVINNTDGIVFLSCQFENALSPSTQPYHLRGAGIRSLNSSFTVNRFNTDSIPFGLNSQPLFKQLSTGIYAIHTLPGNIITINKANFERNLTGAYISGAGLVKVTQSSFRMASTNAPVSIKPLTAGLYLDHCNLFQISENEFTGPLGNIMPMSKSSGMVIHNSGRANNIVTGNAIKTLNYGLLAQNQNRSKDGVSGLRILNNWFAGNEYDISVTHDSTDANRGIALHQGANPESGAEPAGNHFSYKKMQRDGDLHNAGKKIFYHFYTLTQGMNQVPVSSSGIYPLHNSLQHPGDSNYMPAYFIDFRTDPATALIKWENLRQEIISEIEAKIDGGNTNELLNRIHQSNGFDAPELYSKLMQHSPYLSDTVLHKLTKSYYFPDNFLSEVLAANPQFFRNQVIVNSLGKRQPAMPSYLIASLSKHYQTYSGIELLLSVKSYIESARDQIYKMSIAPGSENALNYSTIQHAAQKAALDIRPESIILSAGLYNSMGDFDQSNITVTGLRENFAQEAELADELEILLELNRKYFPKGKSYITPDMADSARIYEMTEYFPLSVYARNMLIYNQMKIYLEPYILPGIAVSDTIPALPPVIFTTTGFSVFPVPASDFVLIDYFTEQDVSGATLSIISTNGSLVKEIELSGAFGRKVLSVHDLKQGIYLFTLKLSNSTLLKQKVIISR